MNAWSLLYDELYMNDMDWVSANGGFEYTPETSSDSPDSIVLGNKINLNLDATAHYTSQESKTQTLDLIESIGDAEAFCRSNAIKYLSRFGKKNGKSKLDILKAIHYCILLYHFSGLHNDRKDAYETF